MKYINKDQLLAHRKRVLRDAGTCGVTAASRMYGLPRQTLYRWKKQLEPIKPGIKGRTAWQTAPDLEEQVIALRTATGYGPKRLQAELALTGVCLGEKAIRGIIGRAGLTRKHRQKRRGTKKQGFYAPYPGYRVQIDTKVIPDAGIDKRSSNARYQFTAVDIGSRIRFCWLYDELSNANSIAFLRKVFAFFTDIGITVECIQTDNHVTFTNLYAGGNRKEDHDGSLRVHPFTKACLDNDAAHILSRPGTPRDNCFVERSHRTDDEEFYYHFRTEMLTNAELLIKIQEWNHVYNCLRLHSSCSYLPPMKNYQKQFASSVTGSGA